MDVIKMGRIIILKKKEKNKQKNPRIPASHGHTIINVPNTEEWGAMYGDCIVNQDTLYKVFVSLIVWFLYDGFLYFRLVWVVLQQPVCQPQLKQIQTVYTKITATVSP